MDQETKLAKLAAFTATCGISGTIYLGIDPGASGAIALLCGNEYVVVDIPVYKIAIKRTKKVSKKEALKTGNRNKTKTVVGSSTRFDYAGISEIFRQLRGFKDRIRVVLEEAPTSTGPGNPYGDVMLNRAYAIWPLFLHYNGYRVEEIRPSVWKQDMGLCGKDKSHSRMKALGMFPKADIKLVKYHDRAEALLLAEWLRRLHAGDKHA